MLRTTLTAAAVAAALILPAQAQDRPKLQPSADVEVNYRSLGKDAGHNITMSQSATIPKMRVEGGAMPGYAIVDRSTQITTVVMTEQRTYMEVSGNRPGAQSMAMPDEQASFRRTGSDTIAGVKCTVWEFTSKNGTGTACITADGVMLRALDKNGSGVEATKVTYAPQPAAKFAPPAGFQKMDMPAGMGGMGQPRPGMPSGGQSFTLPPGVKLPPGMQLPPGVTMPPSR